MNKQELIDKLKEILTTPSEIEEGYDFDDGYDFGIERAISLAEDLDEQQAPINKPEKPVVPQFVADWYEDHKGNFEIHLSGLCINFTCHRERLNDKLANWYEQLENKPIQTLVNMHQFGYEVEKEKLYTVEIPNPNSFSLIILRRNEEGKIYISFNIPNLEKWKTDENIQLTESEIKKDFEWAWKFAEEVEDD